MNNPLTLEQLFDAPIKTVWHALTDEDKMREWYFPQLKKFVPEAGFAFEFTDDGSSYKKDWKVTELIPGKKLSHSWNYNGYPGGSEVTFELLDQGDKTLIRLTHTGIESFPNDPHFARRRFESGWDTIIRGNLKNCIERIISRQA